MPGRSKLARLRPEASPKETCKSGVSGIGSEVVWGVTTGFGKLVARLDTFRTDDTVDDEPLFLVIVLVETSRSGASCVPVDVIRLLVPPVGLGIDEFCLRKGFFFGFESRVATVVTVSVDGVCELLD
mmetsp:Transcript_13179/g.26760  ORF Transcript_13179/g.26760 Transcript_13179/m.26760 type:complete len:127 (-) Transcript_13179:2115-2495(-)